MYCFYLEGGLIGPTKSMPHFSNDSKVTLGCMDISSFGVGCPSSGTNHTGWYISSHHDEEWASSSLLAVSLRQFFLPQNDLHKAHHDR